MHCGVQPIRRAPALPRNDEIGVTTGSPIVKVALTERDARNLVDEIAGLHQVVRFDDGVDLKSLNRLSNELILRLASLRR